MNLLGCLVFASTLGITIASKIHILTYRAVGIFSNCSNDRQIVDHFLRTNLTSYDKDFPYIRFIYNKVTFECNNTDGALTVALDVLLGEKFHMPCSSRKRCQLTNLAFLVCYTSNVEIAKTLKELMTGQSFFTVALPDNKLDMDDYTKYLISVVEKLRWKNLMLLSVHTDGLKPIFREYFKNAYNRLLERREFHLQKVSLNVDRLATQDEAVVQLLKRWRSGDSAIILFGPQQKEFLAALGESMGTSSNETFLLSHDIQSFGHDQTSFHNFSNHDHWFSLEHFQRFKLRNTKATATLELTELLAVRHLILLKGFLGIFAKLKQNETFVSNHDKLKILNDAIQYVFFENNKTEYMIPFNEILKRNKGIRNALWEQPLVAHTSKTFLDKYRNPLRLAKLNCTPGYQKKYVQIENSVNFVQAEHGFKCILCPSHQIKKNYGDVGCVTCTGIRNFGDAFRTECIDPYRNIYFSFNGRQRTTIITLTSLGALLTMTALVIFILHRDTPTVKISDVHFSFLHLITILLLILFNCLVHLYSSQTRREIGYAKFLDLSLFYTANVALVYTKSQKLIDAFSSSVRLTGGEVRRTTSVQVFTVFVFLLVSNGLLFIISFIKKLKTGVTIDEINMTRTYHGNVDLHVGVIRAFLIIAQLVCLTQAFRVRHLPGPMNDAMSLVYATMVTTLTFSISYPIEHFREIKDKRYLHCLIVVLNSIIYVVFLYGKKCYVIVFQPTKNTRVYFNERRLVEVSHHIHHNTLEIMNDKSISSIYLRK